MSRRSFSNQYELISIVKQCRYKAAQKDIRALIIIESAPASWLQQMVQDLAIPYIEASNTADRSDRITSLLGSEQSLLIHELSDRFDAGLFAALAGTVKAGGALIVSVPATACNHFHQRFQKIQRLLSRQWPDVVVSAHYLQPNMPSATRLQQEPPQGLDSAPRAFAAHMPNAAREEQDKLHPTMCQFLTLHDNCCVLITGRRGRGKSMLLARLAIWLAHHEFGYRITSANQSGVSTIYQHCPEARHAFVSPDNAISGIAKTLLVDEASSLPFSTLMGFLDSYEQIILSTTVDGYENVGRAFQVRFAPHVRNTFTHVLELHPVEPWRWARHDPLEQLIDQLLLTDQAALTDELAPPAKPFATAQDTHKLSGAARSATGRSVTLSSTHSQARKIEQAEIAENEALLHALFTLFRDTHYQTTTQDLEHLLDSPDIQIWIVESREKIVAAVLLSLEGPVANGLHEAVVSKKRRLHHTLLPQLLAQCANTADALVSGYARVVRISVVESFRRNGMASRLISSIESSLRDQASGTVAMGASFAEDPASIAFWQSNGYTEFHRGFKANPRTGKKSVTMIKSWNPSAESVIECAAQIHADNCQVRAQLEHSPAQQENRARAACTQNAFTEPMNYDYSLLTRFAANQRSFNDSLGSLDRMASRHDFFLQSPPPESRARYEAALRKTVAQLLLDWP